MSKTIAEDNYKFELKNIRDDRKTSAGCRFADLSKYFYEKEEFKKYYSLLKNDHKDEIREYRNRNIIEDSILCGQLYNTEIDFYSDKFKSVKNMAIGSLGLGYTILTEKCLALLNPAIDFSSPIYRSVDERKEFRDRIILYGYICACEAVVYNTSDSIYNAALRLRDFYIRFSQILSIGAINYPYELITAVALGAGKYIDFKQRIYEKHKSSATKKVDSITKYLYRYGSIKTDYRRGALYGNIKTTSNSDTVGEAVYKLVKRKTINLERASVKDTVDRLIDQHIINSVDDLKVKMV